MTDSLTLAAVERAHILSVVAASPTKVEAARVLGIHLRTLHRRLKEYGRGEAGEVAP